MSIMYPHTSHHASLPTLESSEESDSESHLLKQPTKKLKTELSLTQQEGVPSQQAESSDKLHEDL